MNKLNEIKHIEKIYDNIKITVRWIVKEDRYKNDMFVAGKLCVVEYFYDGMRSKGDDNVYKVVSNIHGIKSNLGNYKTIDECEKVCLNTLDFFINKILMYEFKG